MNTSKNRYQGIWRGNGRHLFTILNSLFLITLLLISGNGFAVQTCETASITPSTPDSQFTVNGDGTVTDNKTGLMWKQCSEGLSGASCTGNITTHTWKAALQLAGTSFAGHTDWRLPNIKELDSIVERQCYNPAINATIFPNTQTGSGAYYWSSTPVTGRTSTAWATEFRDGLRTKNNKTFSYYVRLVRGGQ